MRMKIILGAALAACVAGAAGAAAMTGAQAAADRQAHMKQMGGAMKGIFDELQKPSPAPAALNQYAQRLDALAAQLPSWFPAGSGAESGVKVATKADIWARPAEFSARAAALKTEAHKLAGVAGGGDSAAIQAQFRAVKGACGACHEGFKVKS